MMTLINIFENKAFIEVIKSPYYVHLYFDFVSMLTLDEKQREKDNKLRGIDEIIVSDEEQIGRLDGVIQWLDSLKVVFGEYSLGGYTSNKYRLRLYKEGNHFISIHVVYYQMMHHDNGKVGPQKFRHVLSDKIFMVSKNVKYSKDNRFNHGTIINDLNPSTQIIQVRDDEWLNKFKYWSVDETIKLDLNIDNNCFTLTNVDLTDYSIPGYIGININMFLNDLKRVLIVIREFKNKMSKINISKYWKDGKSRTATVLDIYRIKIYS